MEQPFVSERAVMTASCDREIGCAVAAVMLVVILGAGRRVSGDRRVIGLYAVRGAGGSGAASSARHRGGAERAGGAGRPVEQAAGVAPQEFSRCTVWLLARFSRTT